MPERKRIRVKLVAEGGLENQSFPALVERLLERSIESDFTFWKGLRTHVHKLNPGLDIYGKRLLGVILHAVASGLDGVAVTRDYDTGGGDRLKNLRDARRRARDWARDLPVAIGIPRPNFDAWLLDDAVAVRAGLGFPTAHPVPDSKAVSDPKAAIKQLYHASPVGETMDESTARGRIASEIDLARCNHRKDNGLLEFAEELRAEFGSIPA